MYEWIGGIASNERLLRRMSAASGFVPAAMLTIVLWLIGLVLFLIAGRLRRTVRSNMRRLLLQCGYGRIRIFRFSVAFFGQLAMTIYELFVDAQRLPHALRDEEEAESFIRDRFELVQEQHLQRALSQGRGAIVFAPHLGNFFYYYWLLSRKADCLAVATAGSEELRPIYMMFNRKGCLGLDYDDTPPLKLIATLERHLARGGVVFLLNDFWRAAFPPSTLFGLPSRSPGGTALLALRTKAPVVPLYGRRTKGFRHRLEFGAPIPLHELFDAGERDAATAHMNAAMERMIMQSPSQWFYWFNVHERWEGN